MTGERPGVLLLETIDDDAMAELEAAASVLPAWDMSGAALHRALGSARVHAIMTRGKGRVGEDLLDACRDLVAVARCGVGLDNIDVATASARGIMVLNLPASNARTIAEHTLMLMGAVMRGIVESAVAVRAGNWASRADFDRDELAGRTAGIVGLGNVGARVARLCRAFEMDVVYCDPVRDEPDLERVALDDLLARADVVTLHCPLDDSTRGLLGADRLARMKPGAILVNTARGALVDPVALAERIRSGALAGYGADVLDVEPPPADHPLVGLPHVVLTPHVGSLTRSTYRDICVRSVRNVLAVLDEREPEPGSIFNAASLR